MALLVALGLVLSLTSVMAGEELATVKVVGMGSEEFPVELSYDNDDEVVVPSGPVRDPAGNDWIIYDDGRPDRLNTGTNLYSRVRFTPNSRFRLQAVRFMPLNQQNSNAPCNVYVYREDQQNRNLGDRVYSYRFDRLPAWDNQNANNNWRLVEFQENQYVTFDAGEHFSILYGPAPGGAYPGQAGSGWWNLFDGGTEVQRSFVAQVPNANADPPTQHNQWAQLTGDLLIRANGTYLEDFVDVGVIEVFNGAENRIRDGQWMMFLGTEQTYKAQIANYGGAVDAYVVTFMVLNQAGDAIFSWDVVGRDLARGDTVIVSCDSVWVAEEPGRYTVWAIVQAGDDRNQDNDVMGLDQTVIDPENNPDMWVGYIDEEFESSVSWNEDSGWGVVFTHPGGDQALKVTDFRLAVDPQNAQEYRLPLRISLVDLQDGFFRQVTTAWEGEAPTDGSSDPQWIEVNLAADEQVTFRSNQAVLITYFFINGVPILMDGTPPIAGQNLHMPFCMVSTPDDGQNYFWPRSGDFPMQVRLATSWEAPEGRFLRIIPDTLNFGSELALNEDHTIEALFIAYGTEAVRINNISVSPTWQQYFTISQRTFDIAAQETVVVTVTFRSDQPLEVSTQFLVSNNSQNLAQFLWRVYAATEGLSVREEKGELPNQWGLSQNFPNPFNATTHITTSLLKSGRVKLNLYNNRGERVKTIYDGELSAGRYTFEVKADDLPTGVYLYQLETQDFSAAKKMVIMK
ncbi:MAG: T9SS type A sorting domain-containing protein [bacterium]